VGVGCYKPIDSRVRMNWEEANAFCAQSENNASQVLEVEDWFLHYHLSQTLKTQMPTTMANEYWTGWHVVVEKVGQMPERILKSYSNERCMVYNPLWSSVEPQLLNVSEGRWCIAWSTNYQSSIDYGWRVRECSIQLPLVCQTFVCYSGWSFEVLLEGI